MAYAMGFSSLADNSFQEGGRESKRAWGRVCVCVYTYAHMCVHMFVSPKKGT